MLPQQRNGSTSGNTLRGSKPGERPSSSAPFAGYSITCMLLFARFVVLRTPGAGGPKRSLPCGRPERVSRSEHEPSANRRGELLRVPARAGPRVECGQSHRSHGQGPLEQVGQRESREGGGVQVDRRRKIRDRKSVV